MHMLRTLTGSTMVVANFLLILGVFVLWLMGGFLFSEMVTTVGLITPLFAGYTTAILKYVIENRFRRSKQEESPVSLIFAVYSLGIPLLFALLVGGAIICWAYRYGFSEFEQFKISVCLIESAFGVYVGQFVYSMFKS